MEYRVTTGEYGHKSRGISDNDQRYLDRNIRTVVLSVGNKCVSGFIIRKKEPYASDMLPTHIHKTYCCDSSIL